MDILLSPPLALIIYLPFVGLLLTLGKKLAGPEHPSEEKSSIYGGGEAAPTETSIPGYRPFILIAFFFALLHLGILVIGLSGMHTGVIWYIFGLMLALIAIMLG
ncbi:MAG: hypothetical protein JW750_12225 [Anaerolineaceae bacterium]|nr:hypothetical protein [Anaerolineaceae bacterium]